MSREIIRTTMQGHVSNFATEYNTDGPLEKDGYYRRLQEKRKREIKIAREKHREWLDEQGFE